MSRITLPQGQSVRQVAERLGVDVHELLRHAGVKDAEAPLPIAKAIDVPDGFLRSRARKETLTDAVSTRTAKRGGMNMWLALDIEQKRTRAAGGMRAHAAREQEMEGLEEARRTYLRFEHPSNELAIDLYGALTSTHSIDVRARAFAGQACAYAQRAHLFGLPEGRSKPQALSAAKAALLADPKLADAHVAMALALSMGGTMEGLAEAQAELEEALRVEPTAVWCWAELSAVHLAGGRVLEANDAAKEALRRDASCLRALEIAARLAFDAKSYAGAIALWQRAQEAVPTFVHAKVGLARALTASGRSQEATAILTEALAAIEDETVRQYVRDTWAANKQPS